MSQYYQAVGGGQGPLECSIMTGTINMVFIKDAFIPIVFGVLGFLRILNFVTDINRFCLKYIVTLLCVLSDSDILTFKSPVLLKLQPLLMQAGHTPCILKNILDIVKSR